MCADELHEHTAKFVRDVHDEPVFVAAQVENKAIVAHKVDRGAELPLYLVRITPSRLSRDGEPDTDGPFGLRVALPEPRFERD